MNMIVSGMMGGSPLGGGLDKLTGGENEGSDGGNVEDPEIVQARLEAEQRRQEKHRRMEADREKVRQDIRDKYGIKKKEEQELNAENQEVEGRIGASRRKTPEELIKECEIDDSLTGQLNAAIGKAKTAVSGVAETVKNLLPFGK